MFKILPLKKTIISRQTKTGDIPNDLTELFKLLEMGLSNAVMSVKLIRLRNSKHLNGLRCLRYKVNKIGRYPVKLLGTNKTILVWNKNLDYYDITDTIKDDKRLTLLVKKIGICNELVKTSMKQRYQVLESLKHHLVYCEKNLGLNRYIHCKFFLTLTSDFMDNILGSPSIKTKIEEDFGAIVKYFKIIRRDKKPFSIIYPGNEKREVGFHYIMTMIFKNDLNNQINEKTYRAKVYPFEYVLDHILLYNDNFGMSLETFCTKKMGFQYTDNEYSFQRVHY